MRVLISVMLAATVLPACGTYQGNEIWRRSVCDDIVDVDERTRCLEQATRTESEYKQEVEAATEN